MILLILSFKQRWRKQKGPTTASMKKRRRCKKANPIRDGGSDEIKNCGSQLKND